MSASSEPSTAATSAEAKPAIPARAKSKSRPFFILGAVVAVVAVAYGAFRAVTAGKENTDDAQVSADMVPISARVGGTITALPVADHQAVKKGDLLAQLDRTDYEIKLRQSTAD